MKKYVAVLAFIVFSAACSAQLLETTNLRNAPKIYTEEQHIAWIMDSYTGILNLSPTQKETIYQTILQAYKDVPNSEFYSKIKDDFDLQALQSMQVFVALRKKFKEILSTGQYARYQKIDPYPETCFSLSKDYKLYANSNSTSFWNGATLPR